MPQNELPLPDVFSARDVARALDLPVDRIRALFDSGDVRTIGGSGALVTFDEAMRVMAAVKAGVRLEAPAVGPAVPHFTLSSSGDREPLLPIAVSGSLHAGLAGLLILLTLSGVRGATSTPVKYEELPARLVFLATPGPGGGGGGGGLKQRMPPSKAQRKGDRSLSSPMPDPPPAPPEPMREPEPEPPPPTDPTPPVEAPVAVVKSDPQEQPGVLEEPKPAPPVPSQGPGTGGGAGSGTGTGLGKGNGSGVGEGEGAGMGGGPYRPGSGIEPPSLLREVKPDYTEEARRRGVEGEVVMEIVVRRDGSVGDVRVLKGLGFGLDQRAVDAVRQWRFTAATRLGKVVDVLVEVSMEFKLR